MCGMMHIVHQCIYMYTNVQKHTINYKYFACILGDDNMYKSQNNKRQKLGGKEVTTSDLQAWKDKETFKKSLTWVNKQYK